MTDNQNNKPINLADVPTFTSHFNKYISKSLHEIEKYRKKELLVFCLIIGSLLLIDILFLIYKYDAVVSYSNDWDYIKGILLILSFPFIGGHILQKIFRIKIKERILNKVFSYLGDFRYSSESPHDFSYFRNIACLKAFNNKPHIDDYIVGKYKDIPVEIEEVTLTRTSGYGKNRHTVTTFKGLIFSLPQIKKIETNLIVKNKKSNFTQNSGEAVVLEDVEFNKIYSTSANDQIEARYMLTPTFMEHLKDLNANGIKVTCCFQDKHLYIAIATKEDMFEPPFFTSALNIQAYRKIINQLERILKIIDILKLDNDTGL